MSESAHISETDHTQQSVVNDLIAILTDMTKDWDTGYEGAIQPGDFLMANVGFQSIDWVQFVQAIEQHYQRMGMPWVELFVVDGKFVTDLTVQAIAEFLVPHLNSI
jgi:hypothetical protein